MHSSITEGFPTWSASFFSFSRVDHRGASSAYRSNGTATWTHSCGAAFPNTPSDGWMRKRATRPSTLASTSGEGGSKVGYAQIHDHDMFMITGQSGPL